ncbi:MAG: flagellar protein FliT [Pseudohongiellaceae bacterium]|nr:flagellar protein FliT [Pseudohongiellaceae bacterium]
MTNRAQSEAKKNWQTILDLSKNMLACAQSRDWETLSSLMDARDKLMKLYFSVAEEEEQLKQQSGNNSPADVAALSSRIALMQEQIATIQQIDKEIVEYTKENKEQLGSELAKLRNARKMVKNYQDQ